MKGDLSASNRVAEYASLLRRWNTRINLVSKADEPELEQRHIEDSLQLVSLIPQGIPAAIDLGSGAGFPGLILSIVTGIPFTLVEADRRKAAFLREAIRVTQAPAEVRAVRLETLHIQAPLVTARAVAGLAELLPALAGLVSPGGFALLPKGEGAEDELTDAAPEWQMRVDRHASRTRPGATILKISDIARRLA